MYLIGFYDQGKRCFESWNLGITFYSRNPCQVPVWKWRHFTIMITDLAYGFSLCAYCTKSKKPVQNELILVLLSKRVDYYSYVYYKAYWFHFKNECTLNCKYDTFIELFNEHRKDKLVFHHGLKFYAIFLFQKSFAVIVTHYYQNYGT